MKWWGEPTNLIGDYVALIGVLAISFVMIRFFGLNQDSVIVATVPLSIGYVVWGVLHHKKHGHIDRKILMEYVGLAVLVNIIVVALTF